MENNLLTADMLDNVNACQLGLNWFNKNYPDGLKITKKNVAEAVTKLWKLKRAFTMSGHKEAISSPIEKLKDSRYNYYTNQEMVNIRLEERYDHTSMAVSYGLDGLYNSVDMDSDDAYESQNASEAQGSNSQVLAQIIGEVWEDIREYRRILREMEEWS